MVGEEQGFSASSKLLWHKSSVAMFGLGTRDLNWVRPLVPWRCGLWGISTSPASRDQTAEGAEPGKSKLQQGGGKKGGGLF